MSQVFRQCPECGGETLFEQYHELPGTCPDSPQGECPELACSVCGTALLAYFPVGRIEPAVLPASARRVA
jgi:hypothetical protein